MFKRLFSSILDSRVRVDSCDAMTGADVYLVERADASASEGRCWTMNTRSHPLLSVAVFVLTVARVYISSSAFRLVTRT